ncbi:hypothetical protein ANANG_G00268630 [Anguilla anguilla]|uniref:Uncharacterized protein n=1 Tax=Anguilla anguilla TaxID=7936 RepID=A0A9D3RLS1_ANGAN|nr:hypothetical protein ANANG_G00268630 [Anguilla anguilla]
MVYLHNLADQWCNFITYSVTDIRVYRAGPAVAVQPKTKASAEQLWEDVQSQEFPNKPLNLIRLAGVKQLSLTVHFPACILLAK